LSGSASIASSPAIAIAGGATFNVSGLSSTFALGTGQVLSNSTSTAVVNGNISMGSGTLSLTYAWQTPSLTVTNGTLTLSSGTAVTINNTGGVLGAGTYTLISNATTGNAGSVGGGAPSSVTVTGSGIQPGARASLQISGGTLQLVVTGGTPPAAQITGISLNGPMLMMIATNGVAGGQYVLLGSTNVALPLGQWVRILTNNFNGNGNLNLVTNIVNSNNPQVFYLLQMP
jgi:hypothetical protein